ncbi:MAG: MFS transporter [Pseudomonadota bacterium]
MTAIPDVATEDTAPLSEGAGRTLAYAGVVAFMTAFAVPMSFFFYVFPPMLRELGHSPEVVGGFAMVYLPYVLRGLWAFAIERVMKGQAARYRMGTFGLSILGLVAVLGLIPLDPSQNVGAIMVVAVLVFVIFASGMTTLDGYLLATLNSDDRAKSAAWSAAGVAFGGIVIGLMAWFEVFSGSWTASILALAAATVIPAMLVLILPRAVDARADTGKTDQLNKGAMKGFFADPRIRILLLTALTAHGALGLFSGYLPVLQVDAGLEISEIGLFSAVASNLMGLVGAMLGGLILAKIGGWRTILCVTVCVALFLGGAAILQEPLMGRSFAIGVTAASMFFGYVYFVPIRALILQACDGPHAVSRVAIISSFDMSVGILGMSLAGVIAVQLGLTMFFATCAALAAVGAVLAFQHATGAHKTPDQS